MFSAAGVRPTQLRRKNGEEMDDGLGMEHPIYECVTPLRYRYLKNWGRYMTEMRLVLEHPSILCNAHATLSLAGQFLTPS